MKISVLVSPTDVHFCWSPVTDWLNFFLNGCSKPHQDLGLMKIQFWWPCALLLFLTKFKPQVSTKNRRVDKFVWTAGVPCFGWSKWPCMLHSQSASCFVGFLCDKTPLYGSQGLIFSDVNFNFSYFVHSRGFCFLQVWCPTVLASSGQHVLLISRRLCPIRGSKNVHHPVPC